METNTASKLVHALLEGYAWGVGAQQAGTPAKLDHLDTWAKAEEFSKCRQALDNAFLQKGSGPELMEAVDAVVDSHPQIEDLREILADLVALHLISSTDYGVDMDEESELDEDEEDEDEGDVKWAALEMLFETRGTEVLHVLSYLGECKETASEPGLDDFLNHFVLDEDSETQDDIFVYEELIKQSELVEGTLKQVVQVGNAQREEVMRDLFTPLMLFFRERESRPDMLTLAVLNQSAYPAIHSAILRLLNVFWAQV